MIRGRDPGSVKNDLPLPCRQSDLGELERQCQDGKVLHLVSDLLLLDASSNLDKVLVELLLLQLQIFPQVDRVDLKAVDDGGKRAAVRHQEVDMCLAHNSAVRELAADVLDHDLGRWCHHLAQLIPLANTPCATLPSLRGGIPENDDEQEVPQYPQSVHRVVAACYVGDALGDEARRYLDVL